MPPASAVTRRALADTRVRNLSFACFFALIAFVQPVGYRHSFPTVADRLEFARSFGANAAVRLFYGTPYDLLGVGGYSAWRVGGTLSIFAGVWGLLAAVRALRAEEDAGRQELVLATLVTRRGAFAAALAAVALGACGLWAAIALGLVAGGLPAGGALFLALATVTNAAVFAGVGALVSQLAPTRRIALELGGAVLALALLARVVADTSASADFLRWLTPLGWAEELRPFTGARPQVLALPVIATVLLLSAAAAVAARRDVGAGLLASRDRARPRVRLLSSPTALTLRTERGGLIAWATGIGLFAVVIGLIADSFSSANLGPTLREQLAKVGGASLVTPAGALGFYFLFFILALSYFGCGQIAAARHDEAEGRLETELALPVDRRRRLFGRLVLAAAAIAALALLAAVLSWAGAVYQGAAVSLADLLGAGANCLPTALLFLALGALAFALVPRASSGLAYGAVSLAFVWELFGSVLGAPAWTLGLSPFHHVGLVPAQPFKPVAAAVMVALAAALAGAALAAFRHRDLEGP